MTFAPTALGEALVGGYRAMGLENLWLPDLRSKIEANITAVARGTRTKARHSKTRVKEIVLFTLQLIHPVEPATDVYFSICIHVHRSVCDQHENPLNIKFETNQPAWPVVPASRRAILFKCAILFNHAISQPNSNSVQSRVRS